MGFTSVNLKSSLTVSLAFTAALLCFDARGSANWSSEEPQSRRHIVRAGETLSVIARNYGFEAKELVEYNKMMNPTRLQVGQVIYFPEEPVLKSLPAPSSKTAISSPSRGLNATQFPPDSAKPSAKEYYQLQQFMGGSGLVNPTNDVDYNFPQKQKTPQEEPELSKGFGVSQADMTAATTVADKIIASEMNVSEIDDPEEKIEDRESPALSAFGERPYAYFGNGEDLVDVIQNFAASYYIPTSISEAVIGEVNGKIGPLTPVDFLDHMANIYGFIWYFDGHTLYVYGGSAAEQRIISLSNLSVDQLKKTLKKVGIWDGRFYWKAQPKDGLVFISGPPRYVEMLSQTALLLDAKEGERLKSQLTVRMFPLKYAWASDKTFPFRGQEITVPGVASLLQSIISGGGVANITSKPLPNLSLKGAEGLQGATLAGARKATEKAGQKAEDEATALNEGAKADSVYISADARLNSVIVHDLESKMPMYEDLIKSLDKPTSQIEVSVSIIDIDTNNFDELGVDWEKFKNTNREISFDGNPVDAAYSTIIRTSIGDFNARIQLLAKEDKLKVISRPSILTLDNLEAVLDNSSTFYVSVEGERDAELFPVTSGTVVQVTPRIIREENGRRIHMSVNIQDGSGSQGGAEVGSRLPSTKNSSITTQAIIHEQESLLVGGFYKETDSLATNKVPLLGDIPLLGHLFKSESTTKSKQVRLFLITPRIVGIERS